LNIYSVFRQTPYQRQEVKKAIDYINKEIKEGESIYVYSKGIPTFKFYVNNYVNTKKSPVLYGTWKKTNMESLDKDIATIKNNTWILFSNVYQINTWNDEKYFMDELKKKGFNINIYKSFVGSSCYQVTQN
jgi:hypothetical protein